MSIIQHTRNVGSRGFIEIMIIGLVWTDCKKRLKNTNRRSEQVRAKKRANENENERI